MVQFTKENLIWLALTAVMAAGAIGIVGSGIFSGAANEGLQIGETSIKKPNSGDAVLTVQVRNVGTSSIDSVTVTLNGITLGADISGSADFDNVTGCTTGCNVVFSDTPTVDTGDTNYFTGSIPDSDELNIGDSYTITVTGEIDGSNIVTTGVVTVTRF